ncbi:hypothetical protein [uncultured Microbacterium sp.]|uniref:hypothetical protein n=1 Tax=uncultured Microbacterium sp. TaxID=191216 RepID=UPI0025D82669|nr:hypothetical protein [uncultured Microbacterium sp.]
MTTTNQATHSWAAVNLTPERVSAWCKAAMTVLKTIISIVQAMRQPPFNLPGFPAQ